MKNAKIIALLNSSSLTRPLVLLGTAASALLGSGPAQALDVNALPQGGTVVGGSATIAQSGTNTLNVNQSSNRAVINWQSFNIGKAATTNFNQPSSSSIAVNQVNASTNPSVILGTLNANGQVWILNPNGVYFGKTATVNASGIVASTAHVDVNAFMAGSNQLQMTGGDSGSVVNKGKITVGQGGLAAFVAPSVRNSGTIVATVGKVTLAAGDTYTLDLAGDHLVELGLGATKAVVDQSGKIVNPGGTVEITAKAATQVVDSVINMSGVVDASSVSGNGGSITLAADTINTTSTAQLNASGGGTGNGGTISAVANNTGNYDGSFTAKGGAQGGNGGTVETSGQNIVIAPTIQVDASAANGAAGSWTMDPHDVDIINNSATTGGFAGSTVNSGAILKSLDNGTNVTINATTNINGGTGTGNITLQTALSAAPNGTTSQTTGNLTLRGNDISNGGTSANTITISGGGSLILDINAAGAATAGNPDTGGATFIGDALATIGTVSGGATINLGGQAKASGTTVYTEQVTIDNPNTAISLEGGFGGSSTVIAAPTPGSHFAEITADSTVTIENLQVSGGNQGNGLTSFTGIQVNDASATINNVDITGFQDSTLDGAQHGIGLKVLEDNGATYNVSLTNSSIEDFQKNGAVFQATGAGTTLNVTASGNTITGAGNTTLIAQNGLELYGANGATVNSIINNNTITGVSYDGANTAAGILLYNTNGTASLTGNSVTGGNAGANEDSAGVYMIGATNVTATNNTFKNLGYGIDADVTSGTSESLTVTGGTISGNQTGIYVDPTVNNFSGQNINFSNNSIIFEGSAAQETNLLANNNFGSGGMVVNATPDGNIYGNLQSAVDNEASASTLDLSGTLVGQTIISGKTFTLVGTGATPGKTVLEAPTSMVNSFTTQVGGIVGQAVQAVIAAVNGANVTLQNLTVNGENNVGNNQFLVGIGANNANLTVSNVHVTGVADSTLGANPGGIGIGVYNEDGVDRTVSITGSTIDNFGATGISLQGGHLTATVSGNTVTGAGSTAADRQIGIELYGLADTTPTSGPVTVTGTITGTVSGNTVTKVSNAGSGDSADLNLVDTNNVTASGNTLVGVNTTDNAWGIAASGSDGLTISGNNISKFETGIEAFSYWGTQNVTITQNVVTGNAIGVGLDSYGVNPDTSTITAFDNNLAGNTQSVVNNLNNTKGANFAENWWGSANETAVEASIGGSNAGAVDISPFLTTGHNSTPGNGFTGDLADLTVTSEGSNLSSEGRIQTGIDDSAAAAGGPGTVTVSGGLYSGEEVSVGAADSGITIKLGTAADPVAGVDQFVVGSTATGVDLQGDLQANTITLNSLVALSGNLTLDTSAAGGTITVNSVEGTTADTQNLTLNAGAGDVLLGDVGNPYAAGGAQTSLGTVNATGTVDLTGSQYYANVFNLGAVTLTDTGNTINIHGDSANTAITIGSVDDDVANNEALTLMAPNGTIHVGDIGDAAEVGTVFDGNNTVFTGSNYNAWSFQMGAVSLRAGTTNITSGAGGISIGSLDGNGNEAQSLNLTANGGSKVSLGDIGDTTALNNVTSTGATTLTGTNYSARSFDLGAVTLAAPEPIANAPSVTTITTDGKNPNLVGITIASVDGTAAGDQSLTLASNGRTISLGDVGSNVALGDVTDTAAPTTLTGTTYNADDFYLGAVTLDPTGAVAGTGTTTTITAGNGQGAVDIKSLDGTFADQQALTLNGKGSLGNVGVHTALGAVVVNNTTGFSTLLSGTSYDAASFQLGPVGLDAGANYDVLNNTITYTPTTTKITADTGNITIGNIYGDQPGNESLTLVAHNGTVSLGNISPNNTALGTVTDTDNNGTTLTGTSYNAQSFAFGAVTLAAPEAVAGTPSVTTITSIDATTTDTGITIASVQGTAADQQSLTLDTAGSSVSLGNVSNPYAAGGAQVELAALTATGNVTLTGSQYYAQTMDLGAVTLTDTGNTINLHVSGSGQTPVMTIGSVDDDVANNEALTLMAPGGSIQVGNIGATTEVGTVFDGDPTTFTGTKYEANSFEMGALTLGAADGSTTSIKADSTGANSISISSLDGTDADQQNVTLTATSVSLGNAGANKALGNVTSTDATTLTGTTYEAESFTFGQVTVGAASGTTTTITADDATSTDTGITIGSVGGTLTDKQGLTLATAGSSVSLGDVGATPSLGLHPLGAVTSTSATTLTGDTYEAESFDLGAVTLAAASTATTVTADDATSTDAGITIASVDGSAASGANTQSFGYGTAGSSVSLGNVGGTTPLDFFATDAGNLGTTTLTGTKYEASDVLLTGPIVLDPAGAVAGIPTNTTITVDGGLLELLGGVDGKFADEQGLTLVSPTDSVTVGNLGANVALGAVSSTSPNGTALVGTTYEAESFNLGPVALEAGYGVTPSTTTITADDKTAADTGITIVSVDGITAGGQSLTLGTKGSSVSLGNVGATVGLQPLGDVVDTAATTLTGTTYNANTFNFGSLLLDPTGAVSGTATTTTITANSTSGGTIITIGSVDGEFNDEQNLTLNAAGGKVSLGNVDAPAPAPTGTLGAVIDTNNLGTTLTGTNYDAASFDLGNVTLKNTNTAITADLGGITTGTIDGTSKDKDNLTLNAASGTVSVGDIGDTTALGNVVDTNNLGTTLTGSSYEAASFNIGALTLENNTTIGADTGNITIASVDGTTADQQSLTLETAATLFPGKGGSVSLGNVGVHTALGSVVDTANAGTTLTGSSYDAASFAFGNLTLQNTTSIQSDAGNITTGTIDGTSKDSQGLTLAATGGTVSIGDIGDKTALGAVTDTSTTTLTGTSYEAESFDFGAVTLGTAATKIFGVNIPSTTTITADDKTATDPGITIGSVDGLAADQQNLTLSTAGSNVQLGNVGSGTHLGAVTDLAATTLTGSVYDANSFDFGALTLDNATNITADGTTLIGNAGTIITAGSIDGAQDLTLVADNNGKVSLGNIGGTTPLGNVTDVVNGGTTLTGTTYDAASFDFGNVTLAAPATTSRVNNRTVTTPSVTTITAGNGNITTGTIDGTNSDDQSLTLSATGTVSIADVGDRVHLGAVIDTTNTGTVLTGSKYDAASFDLGNVTLDRSTTITADTGNIVTGAIAGSSKNGQNLTLTANSGTVSLGDIGDNGTALEAVTDTANQGTTLTGTSYEASSFAFGNVTLKNNTVITADTGSISAGKVGGTTADTQNLTLNAAGGTVSLGDVGDNGTALGNVIDTNNKGTTLNGTSYEAESFDFGAVTLAAPATVTHPTHNTTVTTPSVTTITSDDATATDTGIAISSIDGSKADQQSLTLATAGSSASLGNLGANTHLGDVIDLAATTLSGTTYNANTFDFGALTLGAANGSTTIVSADSTSGKTIVTIGSVKGVSADQQNLTINAAGGLVSLGDVDPIPADSLGDVVDTNNQGTTLTGTHYEAKSFDFSAVTLDPTGAVAGTATNTSITSDNGGITMSSLDGTFPGEQNVTLTANGGTVSLGNVGVPTALGTLDVNGSTTLTGSIYDAAGFDFGALILTKNTTLDSSIDNGAITIGSVDSDGAANSPESLVLTAGTGKVSLGNVGFTTALNSLTDTANGGTTLTGGTYNAASFDFGNLTLKSTNTTITATGTGVAITTGTIDGTSKDKDNLTLNAASGTVSVGDIGDTTALGNVVDTNNLGTTLTGSSYEAASFNIGALTLENNTTIGADTGNITIASVDGTTADQQSLTLETAATLFPGKGGSVSLGNVGVHTALGSVVDTANAGTTLTGSSYDAASFAFGNLTLQNTTSIQSDAGNITTGTIDGTSKDSQGLTLAATGGTVSIGDIGDKTALGAVTDTSTTTLTGTSYEAESFDFGAVTLGTAATKIFGVNIPSTTTITADDKTATDPGITIGSVDGLAADQQNLTLSTAGSNVQLGNVGSGTHLGAVTDLAATTLTGSVYDANSFDFGALTLDNATNITADGTTLIGNAGTIITAGSIDGAQDLTLVADNNGKVSLGNIGGTTPLGNVTDVVNGGTTLTGTTYDAASFDFGNVTLAAPATTSRVNNRTVTTPSVTTITAGNGNITTGTIDGTNSDDQSLTLSATGTVSIADVGDRVHLGAVIDTTNTGTVLTGSKYDAASFDLGNVTLDRSTTITADTGNIVTGAIAGSSKNGQNLTLTANSGTVSLGDIGDNGTALEAVTDTANQGTTLTGTSYEASSFAFGNVTLKNNTVITADTGSISAGKVGGTTADTQNLTLNAAGGTVSLGDVGDNGTALGNVIDTNNKGTTLNGTSYEAESFDFGAVTLAAPATVTHPTHNTTVTTPSVTTITSDDATATDTGIAISSIDGSKADQQSLTLATAGSSASLGNLGANTHLGDVIDLAATTLSGTTYNANTFDFGALTLGAANGSTTIVSADSTSGKTIVTIGSVKGVSADQQNLTINAAGGLVSLGDVDPIPADSLGDVVDTNNQGTTLTGTHYEAKSFDFSAVTLDPTGAVAGTATNTSITSDNGGITMSSLDGTFPGEQNVTLTANGGTVSLGNVGVPTALGTLDVNGSTTLTGSIYDAAGFDFGALILTKNTTLDSSIDNGAITIGSVDSDGAANSPESLVLTAGTGKVSLGNVGFTTALNSLTDTANGGTTLTGGTYNAASFDFGNLTLKSTNTTITATGTGVAITTGTIDGTSKDKDNLTLNAASGTVSVGDIGDTTALGNVVDTNNLGTTLTGSSYEAASFNIGALTLENNTTIGADTGNITIASVDGTTADQQSLTLETAATLFPGKGGSVSLGNVGVHTALGSVVDTANAGTTLTGSSYDAASFAFGNLTLQNTTSIQSDAGNITTGTIDGTSKDSQGLTLAATGGTVSIGDIGDKTALGAVTDTSTTTLTGTSYEAESFDFGAVTLGTAATKIFGVNIPSTTTITADDKTATDPGITIGSVDGLAADQQNLTLSTAGSNVQLGNVGSGTHLGAVTDLAATTLTGSVYDANSFDFGALTLDNATNITADGTTLIGNAGTIITAGSIDGAQDLTLVADNNGKVSLGNIGGTTPLGNVTDVVNGGTTLTGTTYDAASFDFGNVTLAAPATTSRVNNRTVTTPSVTTITADNGNITTGTIDGTNSDDQSLTLSATGTVSIADVGDRVHLGAVIDTTNTGTVLTGSKYDAASFDLGNVTLDRSTTITADTGNIVTGAIAGSSKNGQNLTLTANSGTVSLGDIGDNGTALEAVTDTANQGTTLTGTSYEASSFAFGNVTLKNNTVITADTGSISAGKVGGTTADTQNLTLNATGGTVSLGDIGDNGTALGNVIDTANKGTTLNGTSYEAESFDFGAVTLAAPATVTHPTHNTTVTTPSVTTITSDDATATDTGIAIGSIDGSKADQQSLTLATAGSGASLGNLGANTHLGDVIDSAATTLTGTTYNANTFDFGALTLGAANGSTTIVSADSTSGNTIVTIGSVKGVSADQQNLTINAAGGLVLLGDVDPMPSDALGAVIDTNNQGTTLTGTNYHAASFAYGNLTLDNTTTITADTGNISTGTIDGTSSDSQGLTLTAHNGTVSLGDIGDKFALGNVVDTNNKGTTLTGTNYEANSFAFGAVVLDPPNASGPTLTTITADDAKTTDTGITLSSVDGTTAGDQSLTLATAGSSVSLGDIGDHVPLGTLIDLANTTLTGGNYSAANLDFGNLVLTKNTTFTATGTGVAITTGTIDGTRKDSQSLTLNAANGTVLIGDIGDKVALGAVTDTNNLGTTLKGSSYEAASFNFGALTLENNTTIGADTGNITIASVDGTTADQQNLTLETATGIFGGKGTVSLGNVGLHTALGAVVDTANAGTTLTGSSYEAASFDFGDLTLKNNTSIMADTGNIVTGKIDGSRNDAQSLNLTASNGTVSLGDIGDNTALGAVTDTANNGTTLTGRSYEASSFAFGNLVLDNTTTITADTGSISTGKIDGTSKDNQGLTLNASRGTVTLGDIGDLVALGDVTDTNNQGTKLNGTNYEANTFDFGAVTLDAANGSTTTITADKTGFRGASAGTILTIGSIDGAAADQQNLTLNAAGGTVSLGDVDLTPADALGNVIDINNKGTLLTGTNYHAASFDFGNVTLAGSGGRFPSATTTTITTDNGGNITTAKIDGTNSDDQNLTLNAKGGTVSLGDIGDSVHLGNVIDTNNGGTTLTGTSYDAESFAFGAVTLDPSKSVSGTPTTTTITADATGFKGASAGTIISASSVDGAFADDQNLTLNAKGGTVSLGDIGDKIALGNVVDTANKGTTLTGTNYEAASFDLGAVTLDPAGSVSGTPTTTTITADTGNIVTGTVDGTFSDDQNLTLAASNGTVTLGDIGDTTYLGYVVDTANNGTTLIGTSYGAANFDFGNVTLDPTGSVAGTPTTTTITADLGFGAGGNITMGSVDGTFANGQNLTLKAFGSLLAGKGTVSLGNMGVHTALGVVVDTLNSVTTLTGTSYEASSFDFGALTLDPAGSVSGTPTTTTITADTGNIVASKVDGTFADAQNLTLSAANGTVTLADVGDTTALGNVIDTANNGTMLIGTSYHAASFDLGNVTLDPAGTTSTSTSTTTITTDNGGNITAGKIDGTFGNNQALTLLATGGNVSLGDIGDTVALGPVVDTSNNGTTLTGSNYEAATFAFGNVTLDNNTVISVTDSANTVITTGNIDGTSADGQSLTLNATGGTVSLGDIGDKVALGAVTDTNDLSTTLTGTNYHAASFALGTVVLDPAGTTPGSTSTTTVTADGTFGITIGSIDGTFPDNQSLTLVASNGPGPVTLGNVGASVALGNVIDSANSGTTLVSNIYNAKSFDFGAVTLAANVDPTVTATGNVTMGSVDGTTAGNESLTINAGSSTLGNVGANTALNSLTVSGPATLTGSSYNAWNLLDFGGAVTLTSASTTLNTTGKNGAITIASVNGTTADAQALTLTAGTGAVSLGNTGANVALGAVTDNNAITLTGNTYNAGSFTFGATTLDANASMNTSSDNGAIKLASVDGITANGQNLTLNAGTGTVSLGNAGAKIALGNVTDLSNTTLTGTTYTANTFDFGALTLDNNTVVTANSTSGGTIVTIGSVAGAQADTQNLTINAAGGKVSLGDVDATSADALGVLTDTNNQGTTLTGTNYEASSFAFGSVVLAPPGSSNLTTATQTTITADTGGIVMTSVDGTSPFEQFLTLNNSNGAASLGDIGDRVPLGGFTDNGNTTLTGSSYKAGTFDFNGNVTLTQANTTINSTVSSTAAGNITFNGNVLGTTNGGQSLDLIAGPGTGSASANGNIVMQNGGTAGVELDNLTVSGNNFSALTLFLAGNFSATLTGNLTATINANNIDITAGTVTSSELNAVNTVDLTANGINAVNINTNVLDIQATGAITGTWNTLNTESSIDLFLNGQLTSFNAQQLVVEGFTLPNGTVVTANGTLVLPAGVLIGLLSPGGGEPRMVLVHTVQALGELLSEGYVAIVIDLDGDKKDDDKMQIASN